MVHPAEDDFFIIVESFRGIYRGHTPMTLVERRTTANAPRIVAVMPGVRYVKYSMPMTTAARARADRSIEPRFFFMESSFVGDEVPL
jgi:hypothetical protein